MGTACSTHTLWLPSASEEGPPGPCSAMPSQNWEEAVAMPMRQGWRCPGREGLPWGGGFWAHPTHPALPSCAHTQLMPGAPLLGS